MTNYRLFKAFLNTIKFRNLLLLIISLSFKSILVGQIKSSSVDSAIEFANEQIRATVSEMTDNPTLHPNQTNISTGAWEFSPRTWWTSGFFSGVSWYLYELTNKESYWLDIATRWTEDLESQKYDTSSHDVGFQIFCSYGNAYRITGNEEYKKVVINAANSLATRYDETIGAIRSWSWGSWNYPVIIDNMMNLEILMWSAENGGDERLKEIAINHAKKTLENHVREDGSTYHIIDYNNDGSIKARDTHQGFNIESTWSRGQAWALYGFTMMYRYTRNDSFLTAAKKISNFYIDNLPDDYIPYSDFEDPNIPNVSKDASAAAIACSALIELSEYVADEKYENAAFNILNSLINNYLSKGSKYQSVIKRGCVRSGEPERGLIYADYYFLEALLRYKNLITNVEFDDKGINSNFKLFQNYPNPFNPSTTIKFSLITEDDVKLNIFSSLGERLSTLVIEKQSGGNYAVNLDATTYASGVYYYQIVSRNISQTKKMILLR